MASDVFSHVPRHVTLLFLFLCSCQVLLVLHLNSDILSAPAGAPAEAPARETPIQQHPGHGKLRLLWSVNSSSGEGGGGGGLDAAGLSHYRPDRKEEEGSIYLKDYVFHYVLNQPYICQGYDEDDDEEVIDPFLVVLIHSHPSHKPQRDSIRSTWGKRDFTAPIRYAFILGESETDPHLTGVRRESRLYRDLILGNFTDTYRNLTLKALFGLKWATDHCPTSKFILKTDDDTYFNVSRLLTYLQSLPLNKPVILGSLNSKASVARKGLWQVTQDQFTSSTYPSYCSGCAYALSHSALSFLLHSARQVPLVPIEDVYVTGLLAKAAGLQCESTRGFPYWSMGPSTNNMCMLLDNRLFGLHNVNYERMYTIHGKMRTGHMCKEGGEQRVTG